jgi:hypothetical protein
MMCKIKGNYGTKTKRSLDVLKTEATRLRLWSDVYEIEAMKLRLWSDVYETEAIRLGASMERCL